MQRPSISPSFRAWRGVCLALVTGTGCLHSSGPATTVAPGPAPDAERAPFVSFNVPTLHYIEDDSRFESMRQQRLPDDFEIRDALQTIRAMGGTVVRIYTLSVRKPTDPPGAVRHVLGPNQFNEEAFVALDRVLAAAAELGIRVIMPFVDNWPHWGGIGEYAAFRGKRRDAFFTDEQIIRDFEATLDKVLLRKNSINGRAYRDDAAIYAWETGNELSRPDAWAARMSKYVKQHDAKHALIDGMYGPSIRIASLADPNVDIVSSHHYGTVRRNLELIDENVRKIAGRKRYLIGEFGLWPAAETERMLHHVLALPIEGALIWGLRGHSREGGFYHHMERPPYQSYHFTGSDSGAAYGEQAIMKTMRTLAFGARHLPVPPLPAPSPPAILGVTNHGAVSFRGSLGARDYTIERQTAGPEGRWESVADHFDETLVAYRPFVDPSPPVGQKVRYRVTAASDGGRSAPSQASADTLIEGRLFVDEMDRANDAAGQGADLTFTTEHAQRCKMDRARLTGAAGARVVYRQQGRATALRIYVFTEKPGAVFNVTWSSDGHDFSKLATSEELFVVPGGNPDALRPVRVTATDIPAAAHELSIEWLMRAEIGRVEIDWLPAQP